MQAYLRKRRRIVLTHLCDLSF